MIHARKNKLLEVIVTSLEDAIEAEAGGADRLEIVRSLEVGGLTPEWELVSQIAAEVQLPLRVMIRANPSMQIGSSDELKELCAYARSMHDLGVGGIVAGFIQDDTIDVAAMEALSNAAGDLNITFHRAFDELPNPERAVRILKERWPRVDRILTVGGTGTWPERKARLHYFRHCAAPEIQILAGAGLEAAVIEDLAADRQIRELHVGRAARTPRETYGRVDRHSVALLKGLLA